MVNLPNLQSLLPFAQQWATQIIPSGGGITIMGNLRVMGEQEQEQHQACRAAQAARRPAAAGACSLCCALTLRPGLQAVSRW